VSLSVCGTAVRQVRQIASGSASGAHGKPSTVQLRSHSSTFARSTCGHLVASMSRASLCANPSALLFGKRPGLRRSGLPYPNTAIRQFSLKEEPVLARYVLYVLSRRLPSHGPQKACPSKAACKPRLHDPETQNIISVDISNVTSCCRLPSHGPEKARALFDDAFKLFPDVVLSAHPGRVHHFLLQPFCMKVSSLPSTCEHQQRRHKARASSQASRQHACVICEASRRHAGAMCPECAQPHGRRARKVHLGEYVPTCIEQLVVKPGRSSALRPMPCQLSQASGTHLQSSRRRWRRVWRLAAAPSRPRCSWSPERMCDI